MPNAFCILTVSVNVFASNVEATPPVGKPVQFVKVPLDGVPNTGAENVLFDNVSLPDKLAISASETAVFNCANVDVNVLDVRLIVLLVKVSVDDVVTIFTPSMVTTPAEALANVVSVA